MESPRGNLPEYTVSELSQAVKRTVEDAFEIVRVQGRDFWLSNAIRRATCISR
jgi:exonuclease VII large subunit